MEGLIAIAVLVLLGIPVLLIVLIATTLRLRGRVGDLEQQVAWLRQHAAASGAPRATPAAPAAATPYTPSYAPRPSADVAPAVEDDAPTLAELLAARSPAVASPDDTPTPPPLPPLPANAASPTARVAPPAPRAHASAASTGYMRDEVPPPPGFADRAAEAVRRWFTEGNVPVKVGVLVLFAGIAALLKYASDQGLFHVPIELRLTGIALAAIGALVVGWRQRIERRAFGLAVQGGAIGVLLMVLFAASKLYPLMPTGAAFAGSVALVAGLGILAVRQEALALAVLGVLAGFLAPIWLSTGGGSHVALFSYYAVLDAGIVVIAWRRPWRLLNLLGFAFTFGIGATWGALSYRPEDFATTEPFLVLFFAMFVAIPILYAGAKGATRRVHDGSLLFGTPLVAFALQAGLLRHDALMLAYCALAVAALYAVLAGVLRRSARHAELVAPYAVLAVGFATLAVPLALSARATAATFALEGAGLVWLGLRQARRLSELTGFALQAAAAVAFAIALDGASAGPAVLNGTFMTALLIAVGGFATALATHAHGRGTTSLGAYLWGLAWGLGIALWEIDRSVEPRMQVDAVMLLVLGVGGVAGEVARRLRARALELTAAMSIVLPIGLVWLQAAAHHQPLAALGGVAWAVDALVAWRVLGLLRDGDARLRGLAHGAAWCGFALLASLSAVIGARDAHLGDAWLYVAAVVPWLLLAVAAHARPALLAWPFDTATFDETRGGLQAVLALVLAGAMCVGLVAEGRPSPLPYVPLLDPLELVQVAILLLGLRVARDRTLRQLLAGVALALATSIVLRAGHYWGGVPWNASMFSTGLVQTSLTVLWSVAGMVAWVAGSRRQQRGLWRVGAVLLAVVLAKLVLVDRQYLGNLLGIGSFIAFGLLCTAVGYLAPVPPREPETA